MPVAGAAISTVTLSVVISSSGSFWVTDSPTCLNHVPTTISVPSAWSAGAAIATNSAIPGSFA